jgi:hypothetical protein
LLCIPRAMEDLFGSPRVCSGQMEDVGM